MSRGRGGGRWRRAASTGNLVIVLACAACGSADAAGRGGSRASAADIASAAAKVASVAAGDTSNRAAPVSCGPVHVVVLGSSTAEGTGPLDPSNAWVERYRRYLATADAGHTLTNLARGGYTTYRVLPRGSASPDERFRPDTARNIERALVDADAIIVNLPSNDANLGVDVATQLAHYDTIRARADAAGVPIWITTPQPRNFNAGKRAGLLAMRDSTRARYGDRAIDFFSGIARPDGTISSLYDAGDGVHLNDAGHAVLFARVADAGVPEVASCGARRPAGTP